MNGKRKKTASKYKKRSYKKKVRKEVYAPSTHTSMARRRNYVPKVQTVKIRYLADRFSLVPAAGTGAADDHVFQLNGLFDPDVTGAGHQPISFDQYMALYGSYEVTGGIITVDVDSLDTARAIMWGVHGNVYSSVLTSGTNIIENGLTKYNMLGRQVATANYASLKSLTFKWSVKDYYPEYDKNTVSLHGTLGTNPTAGVYAHVFAFPNAAVTSLGLTAYVCIDFNVRFFNPIDAAQS